MQINKVNSQPSFKAQIDPKLLNRAKESVEGNAAMEKYLDKRVKEIASYGDENTVLSYGQVSGHDTYRLGTLIAENPAIPKKAYSSWYHHVIPLFNSTETNRCAEKNDAKAIDVISLMTPENVYQAEKAMMQNYASDQEDNLAKAQELLPKLETRLAPKTYEACKEGLEEVAAKRKAYEDSYEWADSPTGRYRRSKR